MLIWCCLHNEYKLTLSCDAWHSCSCFNVLCLTISTMLMPASAIKTDLWHNENLITLKHFAGFDDNAWSELLQLYFCFVNGRWVGTGCTVSTGSKQLKWVDTVTDKMVTEVIRQLWGHQKIDACNMPQGHSMCWYTKYNFFTKALISPSCFSGKGLVAAHPTPARQCSRSRPEGKESETRLLFSSLVFSLSRVHRLCLDSELLDFFLHCSSTARRHSIFYGCHYERASQMAIHE